MASAPSADWWSRLEPLLDEALDLSHEQRQQFLARLDAREPGTRAELSSLIADCERYDRLLSQSALERFPDLVDNLVSAVMASFTAAVRERYVIERELGTGGMAIVYLARDVRHRRLVAVKVLRPELAATVGHGRFLREIELTAGLDHPYILPLLDSGEAAGFPYYVMPYIEGETLRARLRRDIRLPIADALQIAREVADALSHAHRHGIVHRDVKPENILLAGGHARVADFGIARALTSSRVDCHSGAGIVIGTPAYMSPEQAAGDPDIDERADVYALGCVLYEMLAGDPPLPASTGGAAAHQNLGATPRPVRDGRPETPPPVERAIALALERSRADRLQSAAAFAIALDERTVSFGWRLRRHRRPLAALGAAAIVIAAISAAVLRGANPRLDPNVVAVLPFRVQAPDSAYNYLHEGIVDLLSAQLTGGAVPRAIDSRTALSAWRHAVTASEGDLTVQQSMGVARRLGAGRLLLGEIIATRANRVVTGRLLDARTGQLLAEDSESGSVDELLLVNRMIGRLIAQSLGEGTTRLPILSDSLAAVKEYLAGIRDLRGARNTAARAHLTRALAIDSTFAVAALWSTLLDDQDVASIKAGTERAWKLRGRLSEPDRALLSASFGIGPRYPAPSSMAEFLAASAEAARVNPDRAEVWYDYGSYMLVHGPQVYESAVDRATRALDSAIAIDSAFGPAVRWRLEAAVAAGNRADIRRFSAIDAVVNDDGDQLASDMFVAAQALGDSGMLAAAALKLDELSDWPLATVGNEAILHGFPLAAAEDAIVRRATTRTLGSDLIDAYLVAHLAIAAARGRVGDARALEREMMRRDAPAAAKFVISLALAEPGYEREAEVAVRALAAVVDTTQAQGRICYHALWRVARGDTARTDWAIVRYRKVLHDFPSEFANLGNYDVCPRLLAAMLARARLTAGTHARDSIEAITLSGPGLDPPGEVAPLILARWRAERGEYRDALTLVRRRPYIHNIRYTLVLPAYLREEGRLAAIVGDTAGAIRAYKHLLMLRDQPDAGAMLDEVNAVRGQLALLEQGHFRHVSLFW